jgi:hypothetical protein
MLRRDSIVTGIFAASVFPLIAWLTEYILKTNAYLINRPAVPYFIAIALNLILVRFCLKNDADQTARGVMLATFIIMISIILKIHPLR